MIPAMSMSKAGLVWKSEDRWKNLVDILLPSLDYFTACTIILPPNGNG